MILYHGSKSGIKGEINPFSGREACDFGQGFYMGDKPDQPKGLIANDKMYRVLDDFFGLNICDKALLEALSRVRLGKQYVVRTKRACGQKHVKVISVRPLSDGEIKGAKAQETNRAWSLAYDETPEEIYRQAPMEVLQQMFLGLHVMSYKMAIEDLKEMYQANNKSPRHV